MQRSLLLHFGNTLRRLLATALLGALPAGGALAAGPAALPGEVLVKLRTTQALPPLLERYGLSVLGQFGARPVYRLATPPTATAEGVAEALRLEPDVLVADLNVVAGSPEARRNVVWAIGTASAFATQWAPAALRLPEAHRFTRGAGVRVAVLDTGIDRSHPLFAGRLLPGLDLVDGDDDPAEDPRGVGAAFGHGTHVAGLVALTAPDARILPIRVLDSDGRGNAWVLVEALLHAVDPDGDPTTDDGAHVINLSLGSPGRMKLLDALAPLVTCAAVEEPDPALDLSDPGYAADHERCVRFAGAVVVAAAGNDGSDAIRQYPAAEGVYGLLAIAASTQDGRLAQFSNYGSWVDAAAPGAGIVSAIPGGGFATWSGTSMAAPLAAGTAALLRAYAPTSTPEAIVRRMLRSTSGLCGTELRQVDAAAALAGQALRGTACPR